MISKNHKKNKKFKFDEEHFDLCWEISSGTAVKTGDQDYSILLRETYDYKPSLHEFDADKFRVHKK